MAVYRPQDFYSMNFEDSGLYDNPLEMFMGDMAVANPQYAFNNIQTPVGLNPSVLADFIGQQVVQPPVQQPVYQPAFQQPEVQQPFIEPQTIQQVISQLAKQLPPSVVNEIISRLPVEQPIAQVADTPVQQLQPAQPVQEAKPSASVIDTLTKQILGSSDTSNWKGGVSPEQAAKDMAKIMAGIGITDISQFGKITQTGLQEDVRPDGRGGFVNLKGQPVDPALVTPIEMDGMVSYTAPTGTQETYGNIATNQAVPNTYSERQTGNAFGGTFEGKGNTGYRVDFDASGKPIFYTTGASSSDVASTIKPFAQMALLAAGIGGLEGLLSGATAVPATAELAQANMALGGVGGTAGATELASALASGTPTVATTALTGGSGLITGANAGITAESIAAQLAAENAATGGLFTSPVIAPPVVAPYVPPVPTYIPPVAEVGPVFNPYVAPEVLPELAQYVAPVVPPVVPPVTPPVPTYVPPVAEVGPVFNPYVAPEVLPELAQYVAPVAPSVASTLAPAAVAPAVAGMGAGTGITAGTSGLGLQAGTAGLGTSGLGAGITAGGGLTGTGILAGSALGTGLLGTTGTTALTGTGILSGSTLGTQLLGTGAGTAATVGGIGNTMANLGTGALNTGVGSSLGSSLGSTLGNALTNSAINSLFSNALTLGGGLLQQQTSKEAAQRAQAMIDAETAAAKEAAQFRPVGMTTRFGTSQFQVDPTTGQLVSAGYTLSPEAKAQQDRLVALQNQGLAQAEQAQAQFAPLQTGAQSLFNLGNQYLAQSPQSVAQNYLNQQLALLQPGRELELANLQNRLQQQGRSGLAVAQGGSYGATTPELQALYNARAMQEAQLAAQAQQAGQQQVQFGAGLLNQGAQTMGQYYGGQQAAYSPYTTALGQVQGLEAAGQQPFTMSTGLAQQAAQAGANVGRLGLAGAEQSVNLATGPAATTNPYSTVLGGLGASPVFGTVAGSLLGSLFS